MYWGDRPAMELTAGMILHNLFGRFPNVSVCLSEHGHGVGAVHAAQDGPRVPHGAQGEVGRDGRLERDRARSSATTSSSRPSPRRTCSASWPRSGIDPIVFGSDFPHGEGLAYPERVRGARSSRALADDDVKRIMRDTLASFLGDA